MDNVRRLQKKEEGVARTFVEAERLRRERISIEECSLVVVRGPHKGESLRLDKEILRLGRGEWCDLVLSRDRKVSSEHCECWLDERGVRLRDLDSRNGVFLDRCPVMECYLVPGAKIRLGDTVLKLKSQKKQIEFSRNYQDKSGKIIGKSKQMRKIFSMMFRLGERDVVTLFTGETGTGKTSIARALHEQSLRQEGPFVVVNCGALPASLIEASLFGHEKGAFTGATGTHQGLFEQADGGTLFLDEIAELPIDLQPKLLDVIERRCIRRLGSEEEIAVDFRLMAATNRNLREEIELERFREDLFFRISVVRLHVPPLRERREDIPLLVERLLGALCPEEQIQLTEGALAALQSYLWPGNIRQLRNVLEHAITFLEGETIEVHDLNFSEEGNEALEKEEELSASVAASGEPGSPLALPLLPESLVASPVSLKEILASTEQILLRRALQEAEQKVPEAAKILGISQGWLYKRIKKYGLRS